MPVLVPPAFSGLFEKPKGSVRIIVQSEKNSPVTNFAANQRRFVLNLPLSRDGFRFAVSYQRNRELSITIAAITPKKADKISVSNVIW